MLTKNTAGQKVRVFAFDATTNLPKTGDAANITASISKDFGAFADLTDTSATEEDATKAKGYYLFDISQTETNADDIAITGRSSTGNIVVIGAPARIRTVWPNYAAFSLDSSGRVTVITYVGNTLQTGDAFARLGAPAGASMSADVAAVKTDTGAIKAKTDNLPVDPADASDIAAAFTVIDGHILSRAAPGDAMTLTSGERDAVATAALKLDWTGITGEATRSTLNALRKLRNRWSTTVVAGKLRVYKEDDAVTAYDQPLTSDPAAEPITDLNGA